MTRTIQHQIDIAAPAGAVWAQLVDTAAYHEWNPFLRRLAGDLSIGSTLSVEIAPPGGRAMTFRPTVLAAEAERELRWLGSLLVPGLLDGEHSFRLDALPDGRTRLTQAETFRGLLVGLFAGTFEKTRSGFAEMNIALKHRAEATIA